MHLMMSDVLNRSRFKFSSMASYGHSTISEVAFTLGYRISANSTMSGGVPPAAEGERVSNKHIELS